MRVLVGGFDYPDNASGPASWLMRVAPRWRAAGADVRAVLLAHDEKRPLPLRDALRDGGFGVEVVRTRRTPCVEDRAAAVLRAAAADRPDAFVADCMPAHFWACRPLRRAGVATAAAVRSDEPFYHDVIRTFGRGDWRADALACVSPALAEAAAGSESRVETIPSGTPIPESTAAFDTPFRVVYSGRLAAEQKRAVDVAAALRRITDEVSGVECEMLGDGPEHEAVVAAAGGRVHVQGRVTPEEVGRRLLASHALVLLSDYEGTPTAVAEAMAAGVVPIVTAPAAWVVGHDRNGLVVEDRGDAVVAAVRRLRDDPALWRRLSSAAREHARRTLDVDALARRWLDLLADLPRGPARRVRAGRPRLPPAPPALAAREVRRRPWWRRPA